MEIKETGIKIGLLVSISTFAVMSYTIFKEQGIDIPSVGLVFFLSALPLTLLGPYSSIYKLSEEEFIWITTYIIKYRDISIPYSEITLCEYIVNNNDEHILLNWQDRSGKKQKIHNFSSKKLKMMYEGIRKKMDKNKVTN